MNVYTITLERISTGERAGSMVTRQASEDAARAYAEDAIRGAPEPIQSRLWPAVIRPRQQGGASCPSAAGHRRHPERVCS